MEIIEVTQRSEEWFKARLGIPTASHFHEILTSEGKRSRQRDKYLYKLAAERVSGIPSESYSSEAMERGTNLEEEARLIYKLITGNTVDVPGFCLDEEGYGCSPDGLVDSDGLLEIKCPLPHNHVGYVISESVPIQYYPQIQGQLLVTERKWCDFMSYSPNMKPLILRVDRDKNYINALEKELKLFIAELEEVEKKLKI